MEVGRLCARVASVRGWDLGVHEMPGRIQRFGQVFARNNCGDAAARGQARCFSKVVTDARGNILERLMPAVRNALLRLRPQRPAQRLQDHDTVAPAIRSRSSMRLAIPMRQPIWQSIARNPVFRPAPLSNGCLKVVNQTGGTKISAA